MKSFPFARPGGSSAGSAAVLASRVHSELIAYLFFICKAVLKLLKRNPL